MQEGKKAQAKVQEQQYIFFGFSADVGLDFKGILVPLGRNGSSKYRSIIHTK